MSDSTLCLICQNAESSSCQRFPIPNMDGSEFRCDVCGWYAASGQVEFTVLQDLEPIQRALLSHRLRTRPPAEEPFRITPEWVKDLLSNSSLPSPAVQATNIVRFIGADATRLGKPIFLLPVDIHAIIGAPNRNAVIRLTKELVERKILTADPLGTAVSHDPVTGHPRQEFTNISLSLDGWKRYEDEERGEFKENSGFIAMEFGDPELDPFVKDVVKPAVKESIGYELVDLRDVAQAGIIDNIMRTQIKKAAFLIVDLTNDNPGAYWEGGYAEGLGKPVIYICEKAKFEATRTHFDTNHCTTVLWSRDDNESFKQELVATLRRSLNL